MARDSALEEMIGRELGGLPGLRGKPLFGGWAFLLHGNLLCSARSAGLMLRIGADNETWALAVPGVEPVVMGGRRKPGYVRADRDVCADKDLRGRLLAAAVTFTSSLPKK